MFSSPAPSRPEILPVAPRKLTAMERIVEKHDREENEEEEKKKWVAPGAPKKLPRYKGTVDPCLLRSMEAIRLAPARSYHPYQRSTAHLEPSILRGMRGIGAKKETEEEPTPLTYTPDCPWAPVLECPKARTKDLKNIRNLKL